MKEFPSITRFHCLWFSLLLTRTSEFVRLQVFIHSYDCSCYWTFTESVGAAILKLWYWSTRGVWCLSCSSHGSSSSVLFMIEGDGSDAPWAAALTSLQPQSFGGVLPLNALLSQKVFLCNLSWTWSLWYCHANDHTSSGSADSLPLITSLNCSLFWVCFHVGFFYTFDCHLTCG